MMQYHRSLGNDFPEFFKLVFFKVVLKTIIKIEQRISRSQACKAMQWT